MCLPILLSTLALLSGAGTPAPQGLADELARAETWQERLERDRLVGFTPRSVQSALRELERPVLSPGKRAAALMALGCARAHGERPRLASWALEGESVERRAAVLALGELRTPGEALLFDLAADPDRAVAECALLALLRGGWPAGEARVRVLAENPGEPLSAAAAELLAFHVDPAATGEVAAARTLLDLRFAAARLHGLVDGRAWPEIVLDERCADQSFLDRVIYRAASELRLPGVRDHFLEVVLSGSSLEGLRGAVNAMPAELSQLVAARAFEPPDEKAWRALLEEIDQGGLEGLADPLLERARRVPGLRSLAALLLLRGGGGGALSLLDLDLESADPLERARIAEGLGATGLAEHLPVVAELSGDPDPRVQAAALVARLRLQDEEARAELRARLERGEADPHRRELLEALVRAPKDPRVLPILLDLFGRLAGAERVLVAAALAPSGRSDPREVVRQALTYEQPSGEVGRALIAALAQDPSYADATVLRQLFPRQGEPELDVELALALIRARDPSVLPVLREAMWQVPWNRSVLAAALFIEVAGIDRLRLELDRPPLGATSRDLRRIGFALGEWGGIVEVERMGRRRNSADPALQGALLGAMGARTH